LRLGKTFLHVEWRAALNLRAQAELGEGLFFRVRRYSTVMAKALCQDTQDAECDDEDNQFHGIASTSIWTKRSRLRNSGRLWLATCQVSWQACADPMKYARHHALAIGLYVAICPMLEQASEAV